MRRLLAYLMRYRLRFALGCACLVVTATLAMAIPLVLKCAVDELATQAGSEGRLADPAIAAESAGSCLAVVEPDGVSGFALLIVALAVVQAVVRTCSRFLIFNVARDVEFDLRNDLFAHLERLPLEYYHRQTTGDLMSRLVNDIGSVRLMLGPAVLNLLNTPIYYAYGITIMASMDPWLTLAALSPYPLAMFAMKRNGRRLMEGTLRVQEGLAEMSSTIQENVSGIHVVKSYTLEPVERERFRKQNRSLRQASLQLARVRGAIAPIMRVVSALGILVVLWLGGTRVAQGELSIGGLVAFIGYLNALAWPTMALGWMFAMVQRGRAGMARLEAVFQEEPSIADPDATPGERAAASASSESEASRAGAGRAARRAARIAQTSDGAGAGVATNGGTSGNGGGRAPGPRIERGEIELRDVSFAYPDAPDLLVLQDIDVRIPAGATVALVGRAGSGKTTLLRLLPRLFDATSGEVRIDGRDVRLYPLAELRGAISVVTQEPFLFSTSIGANIAFATEARRAAIAAGERGDGDGAGAGAGGANGPEAGRGEDLERIRDAAAWAAVEQDVESFPRGYETMVGERGITLSGGQKQRVTLARALLSDAPILLLDDALSSVDTHTEERILRALEERRRGRTCVIVAHRLSTVQDADLILVLEGGRIVARGDHQSLLAAGGVYAEIFRRQRLREELEAI